MKSKRLLAILLVLSIFPFFGSITANAAAASQTSSDTIITPMYIQIEHVTNGLTVSGRTLKVSASTFGYSNADNCDVLATLQNWTGSSWSNYMTWYKSSVSGGPTYALLSTSISVPAGQYRLLSTHSVTVGSTVEYEHMTSPTRTVY